MGDDADRVPSLDAEVGASAAGHNRTKAAAKPATRDNKKKDAAGFSRWQDAAREQLGNTVNLVLTLSVASLGFGTNLLFKTEKAATPVVGWARFCVLAAVALLLAAVGVALQVNLSRLKDARWSARVLQPG